MVIVAEEVDAAHRGWAIGLLSAVSNVGYGLAAIVFAFVNMIPYGWRGLYAIALLPLVLIIPLRRVVARKRALRERETRRAAAGENLGAARAVVQRLSRDGSS